MTARLKNLLIGAWALSAGLLASAASRANDGPAKLEGVAPATTHAPGIRFRFHAGAPLLAPAAAGPDGSVIVGTEDGYVHALRGDGSYHWSFTVHGAVSRAPLVTAELVFIATSADRVYALAADGTLVWVFAAPAGVESELSQGPNGLIYFLGRDHYVYALTVHGSVALRMPAGDASVGPVVTRGGDVWLGSPSGELRKARLAGPARVLVGAPVRAGLESNEALYWLVGQDLLRTGSDGKIVYRVAGVARTAGPASITEAGDCIWLSEAGQITARLSPCARPGARPVLGPEGELWLASDDGVLVVATPNGKRSLSVAASRLLTPVWSSATRQLLVSAREGLVLGVVP